jgi:hypothetical protein
MVIYGTVLVLIVMFAPRGVAGTGLSVRRCGTRREAAMTEPCASTAVALLRRPEGRAEREPGGAEGSLSRR